MKILWLLRRTLPANFNGPLEYEMEQLVGKNNIFFYGDKNLPTQDCYGIPYYPSIYHMINQPIDAIVRETKPDIVMFDKPTDGFLEYDKIIYKVPIVTFMMDTHGEWLNRQRRARTGQLNTLFVRGYGNGVGYRVKKEICNVGYSPLCAPSQLFFPIIQEKINDVHLAGCLGLIYPLRCIVYNLIDRKVSSNSKDIIIRNNIKFLVDGHNMSIQQYIESIQNSKIILFDTSLFNYPLMKFFEGMACNALVMSNLPDDYEALRFKPNENMIEINLDTDIIETIKYYLRNENELKRIADNGMKLFQKYHTAKARAEQLYHQFEIVISSYGGEKSFESRDIRGEAGRMLQILEQNEQNYNPKSLLHQCIDKGLRQTIDPWYAEANKIWNNFVLDDWKNFIRKEWQTTKLK